MRDVDVMLLINIINDCENYERRKLLCDIFASEMRRQFYYIEYHYYDGGVIGEKYINFDSCCGLSVVEASIDFKSIADYANGELLFLDLDGALVIMDQEFGERTETWIDVIDDKCYILPDWKPDEVVELLWGLYKEDVGEEKFKEDIKPYLIK